MASLFERERSVISKHLRNIFRDEELDRSATCAFFAQVQTEGARTVTRQVEHYNLDAIAEWLPKVVENIDKDALKKLKPSTLRGQ